MKSKNFHVIVVTKDKISALVPLQGQVDSTILSDPTGKIAESLHVTLLPQIAHFVQGRAVWSKPPKQDLTDATVVHMRELGFKEMESTLRRPLDKELAHLKSLSDAKGCSNEKK